MDCTRNSAYFHRQMRYVYGMRGKDEQQVVLYSHINVESLIPADHPLRSIRTLTDRSLQSLSADFDMHYARRGRNSVPPERLLRALLLQVLYSVRSEGSSEKLLVAVVAEAEAAQLISAEHFTIDGTMIQAWAHRRRFHPKDPRQVVGTGAQGRKLLRTRTNRKPILRPACTAKVVRVYRAT